MPRVPGPPRRWCSGGGRWVLDGGLSRRTLLKGASGAALTALRPRPARRPRRAAGLDELPRAGPRPRPDAARRSAARRRRVRRDAAAGSGAETVYVFNVGSKDVTLIDAAARQARETRPLGAAVRWLSNEQTYWDGQLVWTYDFPDNKLQAIGIDPRNVAVQKTIPDLGNGPGHSLMLLPDKKTAAINVAGDNVIAVIDVALGPDRAQGADRQVSVRPALHARWPLRLHARARPGHGVDVRHPHLGAGQDGQFPPGSQPYMLRVSPDGKEVWVQTGKVDTNVVLNASDLSTLATLPTGKGPVTNAWTPDARYSVVTNSRRHVCLGLRCEDVQGSGAAGGRPGGAQHRLHARRQHRLHVGDRRQRGGGHRHGQAQRGQPAQSRHAAAGADRSLSASQQTRHAERGGQTEQPERGLGADVLAQNSTEHQQCKWHARRPFDVHHRGARSNRQYSADQPGAGQQGAADQAQPGQTQPDELRTAHLHLIPRRGEAQQRASPQGAAEVRQSYDQRTVPQRISPDRIGCCRKSNGEPVDDQEDRIAHAKGQEQNPGDAAQGSPWHSSPQATGQQPVAKDEQNVQRDPPPT